MHDPRLSYIYMSKDLLLQSIHEAAAKHGTRSISSISFQCQTKLGLYFVEPLWYGRSWPWSQSERGKSNLEDEKWHVHGLDNVQSVFEGSTSVDPSIFDNEGKQLLLEFMDFPHNYITMCSAD